MTSNTKMASDAEAEEEREAKEALAHSIRLRCSHIGPQFGEQVPGLGLSRDRLEDILKDIPGDVLQRNTDRQTYDFLFRVLVWLECDVEVIVSFRPQPEFRYGPAVDPLEVFDPTSLRGQIVVTQKE